MNGPRNGAVPHPLDPLRAEEFQQVVAILRRDRGVDERWRYASIELREPLKAVLRDYQPGTVVHREARVVCWNRENGLACKAIVSLTAGSVLSWIEVPDEQPNMTVDEWHEAQDMLLAHPDHRGARRRGITDLYLVVMDTWTYGHALIPEELRGRRLGWTDTWCRPSRRQPLRQPGQRPALRARHEPMELLRIEDTFEVTSRQVMGEYARPRARAEAPRRPQAARHRAVGRGLVHRWPGTRCAGRTGRCGSASTTARAWSCTRSATTTAAGSGRSRTGCRSPR